MTALRAFSGRRLLALGLLSPLFTACMIPAQLKAPPITALVASDTALVSVVLEGEGADSVVASITPAVAFTDLARDPKTGALYGVTSSMLYRVDARTGAATAIGNRGLNAINALAANANGELFGADEYGHFYRIDAATGSATRLNEDGHAEIVSGDLAFSPEGVLYATVVGPTSRLVTVNTTTGDMSPVGLTGFDEVYGLTFRAGTLFGITRWGQLLSIDRTTGQARLVRETTLRHVYGME